MASLVASILLHVLLGVALACAMWAVGLGLLLTVVRTRDPLAPDLAVLAYPAGLLAAILTSVAFLVAPVLGVVVTVLALLAAAVPFARRAALSPLLRACARPLAWASPLIVGLPLALSLVLHGPTADVPSSAYGDYVFWATRAVSAARSLHPFEDLLVADRTATFVEGGTTFLGGALTHLPGFDVFLFQVASLPAVLLVSICLGLTLLARAEPRVERSPEGWLATSVVLALLGTAMIAYPTWLSESPPVSLAVPLGFSVYVLWRRPLPVRALAAVSVVLAADLYVTKGFTGLALLVVLGVVLVRDHRELLVRRRAVRTGAVAAGLIVLLAALWSLGLIQGPTAVLPTPELEFVPWEALRGLHDQLDGRDTQALAPALAVLGQLLLGAALVRTRNFTLAAVLAIGLLTSWTIRNYAFDLVIGVTALLSVVRFWTTPAERAAGRLLPAAAICLAISAWFRDISGVHAGFVFVLLLAAFVLAVLLALAPVEAADVAYAAAAVGAAFLLGLAQRPFVGLAALVVLAAVAHVPRLRVAAPAAALVVAAVAVIAAGGLKLSDQQVTLTTEHRDIWRQVEERVPDDGLVFTSMTGAVIDGDRGWNYYPGVAGRQLYIGGWYDGPLLVEPEERSRRLRLNREILAGRATPEDEPIARDFDGWYAVVRRSEDVPPSFDLLYENDSFALYRIPA